MATIPAQTQNSPLQAILHSLLYLLLRATQPAIKKKLKHRRLQDFLHAITAETLNNGLIDRLFYLQEYMLDDEADNLDCYKKTVISGSTFTLTKECTVPYDAGSSFKGLSGSFSESWRSESSTGLNTKLGNLKIDVDDAVFTANGTLNIKDSANTETHSTNDLVISSEATGNKFYFKNFILKNTRNQLSIYQ